jgi:hypothetical protein
MNKAEKTFEKAQKAIAEVKVLQNAQNEVKAIFTKSEASEGVFLKKSEELEASKEYAQACADYREIAKAITEALAKKVFSTGKELALYIGATENYVTEAKKSHLAFLRFTEDELKDVKLSSLKIKAMAHKDPKGLKALLAEGTAEEIAEQREATDGKGQTSEKKLNKAIETALVMMADTAIDENLRWSIYTRIYAGAKIAFPTRLNPKQEALKKLVKA